MGRNFQKSLKTNAEVDHLIEQSVFIFFDLTHFRLLALRAELGKIFGRIEGKKNWFSESDCVQKI